jgi:hypothetical protein
VLAKSIFMFGFKIGGRIEYPTLFYKMDLMIAKIHATTVFVNRRGVSAERMLSSGHIDRLHVMKSGRLRTM